MSDFTLHLDEENELKFGVSVDGAQSSNYQTRFIIEGKNNMSLTFEGNTTSDGEIAVVVPTLTSMLSEGVHDARLEVVVDDRLFVPLELKADLKKALKVTAESKVPIIVKNPSVTASIRKTSSKKNHIASVTSIKSAANKKNNVLESTGKRAESNKAKNLPKTKKAIQDLSLEQLLKQLDA